MVDYLSGNYVVRNADASVPVTPCLIVGKAVEESLRLAYRPPISLLPKPVHLQVAADIHVVRLSNVFCKQGDGAEMKLGDCDMQVHDRDARLALQVARDVLQKFVGAAPYFWQVLTCDHSVVGLPNPVYFLLQIYYQNLFLAKSGIFFFFH